MSRAEDASTGLFGAWDGLLGTFGVLVAIFAVSSSGTIIRAGLGAAVAASISMGTGQYESDSSFHRAVVMGLATAAGAFLPALPFLFLPRRAGMVTAAVVCLGIAVLIGHVRHRMMRKSRWVYLTSPAVFSVAAGLTYLISTAIPQSAGG